MDNAGFPWNGDSMVEQAYSKPNCLVFTTQAKTKKAMIFFSGNGIYFPNDIETFKKVIFVEHRYEWMNIAGSPLVKKYFERIIFVRDIYKQWYVTGIDKNTNSIDKVVDLMKRLTDGFEVTTCGNSAGGYMAALVGSLIGAERVFDFSGQFTVEHLIGRDPFITSFRYTDNAKYYSLARHLKNPGKIYYFYPQKSDQDIWQYELIKTWGLRIFAFDRTVHGASVGRGLDYIFLFIMTREELNHLADFYSDKVINPKEFSVALMNILGNRGGCLIKKE